MPENHAVDYYSNIDLHLNQLQNVLIDVVETDPSGTEGRVIYNTTDKVLKYHDGTSWTTLARGGDLSGYQLRSEKDSANGYAGLDANTKIIIGQLPTGNGASTIPLIVGTIADGAVLQYSQSSGGFVSRVLGTIYTYVGSVDTYDELPSSGVSAGAVYNVVQAHDNVPAGTNYAWTGSSWDALGGTIDTSGFQTTSNLVQDLDSPSATTYPSTSAVSAAIAGKQDAISLTENRAVVSGASGSLEASAVTATELGYLSGVGSAIQTQLDGKQATITGAATSVVSTDLTASMVLVSNANGKIAASSVSSTILGYLANITSDIQAQVTAAAAAAAAAATAAEGKVDKLSEGPTAGTYAKVTVNDDGLVTGGTNLEASDIPDISATYQVVSQKNAADGYAGLDGDSKVAIANLPTGNGADLIPVPSGAGTAGQALVVNEGADGFEFSNLLERVSAEIQGDGTTTSFPISHGLRGPPVGLVIVDDTTKGVVQTSVEYTSDTQITVNFNTAPSASSTFTVYMVG